MSGALEVDLSDLVDVLVERIVSDVTERLAERLFGTAVTPAPEPQPPSTPRPPRTTPAIRAGVAKARAVQDSSHHTCEICGRTGTRRYVETTTGWRCSRTATACPGNREDPERKVPNPALATDLDAPQPTPSDIATKPFQTNVTPRPDEFCRHCMQHHDHHDRDQLACPTTTGFSVIHRFQPPVKSGTPPIPSEPSAPPQPTPTSGVTARCQDCSRTWTLTGRVLTMAVETHELKHAHIVNTYEEARASG